MSYKKRILWSPDVGAVIASCETRILWSPDVGAVARVTLVSSGPRSVRVTGHSAKGWTGGSGQGGAQQAQKLVSRFGFCLFHP